MTFLAPLFLIGAAGVAIPLVLHLIRRQAKGQQEFSSLIFLDSSPPTLLQRSRIDQWLLLLLRGLAVLLLAAAFARPYWNTQSKSEDAQQANQRAILVDTSASMQREGIWPAVIEAIKTTAQSAQPFDKLALYAFDDHVRTLLAPEDLSASSPGARTQQLLAAMQSLEPSSRGTNLGLALTTVGDRLVRTEETDETPRVTATEIILISDFQSGSMIDRLENYQWPAECKLTIKRVEPKNPENVSASILLSKDEMLSTSATSGSKSLSSPAEDNRVQDGLAIRVSNQAQVGSAKVTLRWHDQDGKPTDESEVGADVPANGNVVVRIPKLKVEAGLLQLDGDAARFDNQRYLARPPKRAFSLVCLDQEKREANESLGYFLKQLPLDDETREVQFVWRSPGSTDPWPDKSSTPLIVVSHAMLDGDAVGLKKFIENGGHGVWVLDQSLEDQVRLANIQAQWLSITGESPPEIREANISRDAMFEEIDFTHSLFRNLADSRFNDFTKIRFWKHRCVELGDNPTWTTIARYDDSLPAIAYRSIGKGRLWLLTSGWQPSESQLALSSKFVPIVSGIFGLAAPLERPLDSLIAGDKIECLEGEIWSDASGKLLNIETDAEGKRTAMLDQLGFYRVQRNDQIRSVAVNLPIAESDTKVMEIERLERLGVLTSDANPTDMELEKKEQLRGVELESQQRIWRWLLVGMLAAIVLETAWGLRR